MIGYWKTGWIAMLASLFKAAAIDQTTLPLLTIAKNSSRFRTTTKFLLGLLVLYLDPLIHLNLTLQTESIKDDAKCIITELTIYLQIIVEVHDLAVVSRVDRLSWDADCCRYSLRQISVAVNRPTFHSTTIPEMPG